MMHSEIWSRRVRLFAHPLVACCATALIAGPLACSEDVVSRVQGQLQVTAINPPEEIRSVRVSLEGPAASDAQVAPIRRPETVVFYDALPPGTWRVEVRTRDATGEGVHSVFVSRVQIRAEQTTDIVVDLKGGGARPTTEVCDGEDNDLDGIIDNNLDLPVCVACVDGAEVDLDDDDRCSVVGCGQFNRHELRGDNTASGHADCIAIEHADITAGRCVARGVCRSASADVCQPSERTAASAPICRTISNCEGGRPTVQVSPDNTPCGGDRICLSGICREREVVPPPDVGCSDGTREGFLDQQRYPSIAACSGGWQFGGVTPGVNRQESELEARCDRKSGNSHPTNSRGTGCTAEDLCAEGWRICRGKDEVRELAGDCEDATPLGPNHDENGPASLFFAVRQHSEEDQVCQDANERPENLRNNDVFGCGSLGNRLATPKNCAPLTRVFASAGAGSCGWNQAEPVAGPWQCPTAIDPYNPTSPTDPDSHIREGGVVTKYACDQPKCSQGGNDAIATHDKGGVLCCRAP